MPMPCPFSVATHAFSSRAARAGRPETRKGARALERERDRGPAQSDDASSPSPTTTPACERDAMSASSALSLASASSASDSLCEPVDASRQLPLTTPASSLTSLRSPPFLRRLALVSARPPQQALFPQAVVKEQDDGRHYRVEPPAAAARHPDGRHPGRGRRSGGEPPLSSARSSTILTLSSHADQGSSLSARTRLEADRRSGRPSGRSSSTWPRCRRPST